MTSETFTKNQNSTFSGEIEIEDFNTYEPNRKRICNQANAAKMQQKQTKEREYMRYTLEELREMKLISNTNGRPLSSLTDEKWQKEFQLRKLFVRPVKANIKKMGGAGSMDVKTWNEENCGEYKGMTNWQSYCHYINDILRSIRSGQTDYCYFIYQIMDLLKFHYKDLRTRYCDGYWEVWLAGKGE